MLITITPHVMTEIIRKYDDVYLRKFQRNNVKSMIDSIIKISETKANCSLLEKLAEKIFGIYEDPIYLKRYKSRREVIRAMKNTFCDGASWYDTMKNDAPHWHNIIKTMRDAADKNLSVVLTSDEFNHVMEVLEC